MFGLFLIVTISAAVFLIHEAGHVMAARACGFRFLGVVVCRYGIGVRTTSGTQRQALAVAAAGPLVNLLLAAALWDYPVFRNPNLAMGLVNLLPIRGSDGLNAWQAFQARNRAAVVTMPVQVGETRRAA